MQAYFLVSGDSIRGFSTTGDKKDVMARLHALFKSRGGKRMEIIVSSGEFVEKFRIDSKTGVWRRIAISKIDRGC